MDLKENELVLKVVKGQKDYLSCEVTFLKDKKSTRLGQLHLIEIMVKNLMTKLKIFSHKMPDIPKLFIVRPLTESEKIFMEGH